MVRSKLLAPQIIPVIASFIFISLINHAYAQTDKPKPISPDSIIWSSPPTIPGLQAGWVVGAQDKPGLYILRVKLKAGTIIPPHTHPDERSTTVLAGTIYVGFGEVIDQSKVVAVPTGSVYVVPANVPHYILAKGDQAIYQESGYGPTANKMIKSN